MSGRWADPAAFRADPDAAPALNPARRQTVALLTALVLVAGAVVAASYLLRPEKARAFDLFHGSVFLSDQHGPVAVDLAGGKPTLQLRGVEQEVGLAAGQQLSVVPLVDHTLLLNESTGEFNMVDNSGFVVKHDGGGVQLAGGSVGSSFGVAAANGDAYIVRTDKAGGTDVYLVNQTTVESAINASGNIQPRASVKMAQAASRDPGGAASANGALWLLVGGSGATGPHTVRQLSVPAGSSAGVTLATHDHGTVGGPAAIGTATSDSLGNAASVVAVASPGRIKLFSPGGATKVISIHAPAGVTQVLPTSNAQGRVAFLLHGAKGWYLESVDADGSNAHQPTLLAGLPANERPAIPAASNGRLYTIDTTTGDLYMIGYDGTAQPLPRYKRYPTIASIEATAYGDAYVIARGPRVIFNSAAHNNALVVFTDGSHLPQTIAKNSAVAVSAAGGAEALTRGAPPTVQKPGAPTGTPKPVPAAAQPINNKIDCKTVRQKPHIPKITTAVPGSRTVTLTWSYPVIDAQDCYPSTYVVSVQRLSADAPPAPSSVQVQGQTGVTLSGLFPHTQYAITVTAYINGQGTSSEPWDIQTGAEGPAAPTDLAVTTDSSGAWQLRWNSCGTVAQGCVAAQSWTITPSYCDARGVSSPPAAMTVTADPTAKQQPPATYPGSDDLLGRGLQFQVVGIGDQGQVGTPSAKSPCLYSWSPPNAAALTLSASRPADTSLGGSSATDITLDLGADPVRDVGGVGALVTFRLSGSDGSSRTKGPVAFNGNGASMSANFTGVTAGVTYTAMATVRPAHGAVSATVGPAVVQPRANWPAMSLSASCPATGLLHLSCDLSVTIHGLSSAQAKGELFDTTDTDQALSGVRCGNRQVASLSGSSFDPSSETLTASVSLLLNRGADCAVTVVLKESQGDSAPLVFGGTTSPVLSTGLGLGNPGTLGAADADFGATWEAHTAAVSLAYNGPYNDNDVGQLTGSWTSTVLAPDGTTSCGSSSQQPTHGGIDISVDGSCIDRFGDQTTGWSVTTTYTDAGTNNAHTLHPADPALSGGPPTYQFCTPSNFSATWGGTADAPTVEVGKPDGDVSGCKSWSYQLSDPNQKDCQINGGGAPPTSLSVNCEVITGTWTLTITWKQPAGQDGSAQVTVAGTPPTPTSTPPSTPPPTPTPTST